MGRKPNPTQEYTLVVRRTRVVSIRQEMWAAVTVAAKSERDAQKQVGKLAEEDDGLDDEGRPAPPRLDWVPVGEPDEQVEFREIHFLEQDRPEDVAGDWCI